MFGGPSVAQVRAALVELRTRGGISDARLEGSPVLELRVVQAAMYERQATPEDLPSIAFDVLHCEGQKGDYTDMHRDFILETLNFAARVSELKKRREGLRTKYGMFGKEYDTAEEKAYARYSSNLVALTRSRCNQEDDFSLLHDIVQNTQRTFDELAISHLKQALDSFRYGRSPEQAREKALDVLSRLPLARKRLQEVRRFSENEQAALKFLLQKTIQRAYSPWIAIRRVLVSDGSTFLSYKAIEYWTLDREYDAGADLGLSLASQERRLEERPVLGARFLYWNSRRPDYPGYLPEEGDDDLLRVEFQGTIDRSIHALAELMLWIEANNNWDWILPDELLERLDAKGPRRPAPDGMKKPPLRE